MKRFRYQRGYTFVELLVVTALLSILASAIMPMARVASQRQREIELRRALRDVRTAIDHYKEGADQGVIGVREIDAREEESPPDLDVLVEGVPAASDPLGRRKLKFLRRVPIDP